MRKIFAIAIVSLMGFIAAESTASAQLLKNLLKKTTTENTVISEATTNGQAAGAALKSLYTQFKSAGKLDMSNLTNIMSLATLATNIKGLKQQSDKTSFYKDFATGLVVGSNNLVTNANSTAVMSGLSNLVNNVDLSVLQGKATDVLSNINKQGSEVKENANQIATSVSSILNIFKK